MRSRTLSILIFASCVGKFDRTIYTRDSTSAGQLMILHKHNEHNIRKPERSRLTGKQEIRTPTCTQFQLCGAQTLSSGKKINLGQHSRFLLLLGASCYSTEPLKLMCDGKKKDAKIYRDHYHRQVNPNHQQKKANRRETLKNSPPIRQPSNRLIHPSDG